MIRRSPYGTAAAAPPGGGVQVMMLDAADSGESWSSCRGARVLVVDDDDDMRTVLTMGLSVVGCVASSAASGDEALERLAPTDGEDAFDLVLIDQSIPGMTGLDVLRRLRRARGSVPAILMTGFAGMALRVQALAIGVHVLEKPFSFEALRRTASLLLISRRLERSRALRRHVGLG